MSLLRNAHFCRSVAVKPIGLDSGFCSSRKVSKMRVSIWSYVPNFLLMPFSISSSRRASVPGMRSRIVTASAFATLRLRRS